MTNKNELNLNELNEISGGKITLGGRGRTIECFVDFTGAAKDRQYDVIVGSVINFMATACSNNGLTPPDDNLIKNTISDMQPSVNYRLIAKYVNGVQETLSLKRT